MFLFILFLVVVISGCNKDDSFLVFIFDYILVEDYLKELGFIGSVLIWKGNIDLFRIGFGMVDKVNNIFNVLMFIYCIGFIIKLFIFVVFVNFKRDGFIESFD